VVSGAVAPPPERLDAVSRRITEIAETYRPPDFAEVPGPDAALFLTAIDHGTGFQAPHAVNAEGPFEGSALLWALGVHAEERHAGTLSARNLSDITEAEVAAMFSAGGEVISNPAERARLWRDLARGMMHDHNGSADALIECTGGRLGGPGGMLEELSSYEAFSDPLRKKSMLFCKIAERRGWFAVTDPENWEVCADSVLMRLALRSGLVGEGRVEDVREATRDAFAVVSAKTGIPAPVLDDLLWELGREDADLLGQDAGDLFEPPRPEGGHFY
jgi:hypothetical protein